MAVLFNDADGCFDRIPPPLATLALRRIGCPKSITKAHIAVQKNMKHYVKTATGVSTGFIQYAEKTKWRITNGTIMLLAAVIGGIGQGGGASPIIWMAVLLILLKAYKMTQEGASITDVITGLIIPFWIISYVDDNSIVRQFPHKMTIEQIMRAMKTNLDECHKLLQLTGGDLSLEKCKVIVLKWVQDSNSPRGNLIPATKEKYPGTVMSESLLDKSQKYSLERIDPGDAERVLGVRLPLTGSMETEFKYRKQQLLQFGKALYRAPLTHYETQVAFQSRYQPMASYPLPVTLFSTTQLNEIQKPCMRLMLPKLGLNRNTPRVLIYGPRRYGGLQICNLIVEQPVKHVNATVGHIRRGDRVGTALLITLRDTTQVESGISQPFYTQNPHQFGHLTQQTRWMYFWKMAYEYNLTIEIHNMWTPKPSHENDKKIMEVAMKDTILRDDNYNKLRSINKCRLYLECFFLSDIMTKDEKKIDPKYLDGRIKRKHKELTFPDMRMPNALEWSEWKSFMFRNFLSGPYIITPALGRNQGYCPYIANTSEISELKKLKIENTLEETIAHIPTAFSQILGQWTLPMDNGAYLAQRLKSSNVIGASDGSLLRDDNHCPKGGHAYSIQAVENNEQRMYGQATTPLSTNMSSLTTELYGLIATTLSIYLICKQQRIQDDGKKCKMVIYADNKEAPKREKEIHEFINISETLKPEYDLTQLLQELLKITPIDIAFVWVRGHQDELENGNKIAGPFQRHVQLNIEMDTLAKAGLTMKKHTTRRRTLQSTRIGLYTDNGVFIDDLKTHLQLEYLGKPLKQYLMGKFWWTDVQFQQVDWLGIERTLGSYKPCYRHRIAQLMHDWQYTGDRKELMGEKDGACPFDCNLTEGKLHYMWCESKKMREGRAKQMLLATKSLKGLNTYPGIITIVQHVCKEGYNEEWIKGLQQSKDTMTKKLVEVTDMQKELGTNSLLKGHIVLAWGTLQEEWEKMTGQQSTKIKWTKQFISILHTYTYECWKVRNEELHKKEEGGMTKKKKETLQQKIEELYNKGRDNLNEKEKKYFDMPAEQRKKRA